MPIAIASCREFPALPDDERLSLDALANAGIDAEITVWNDPETPWHRYEAVVVRTTWDYHRTPDGFLAWLASLEAAGQRVLNDPSLIAWNVDKRYLADLVRAGVETVPTRFLDRGQATRLDDLRRDLESDSLVIKPTVDASGDGAWRTDRLSPADAEARLSSELARHHLLAQPLVESIFSAGEVSMMFFGGDFSHAVRKRAADGEFRIHEERGGRTDATTVSTTWIERARRAVEALPITPAFARVDMVEGSAGPLLMELEVVEPELYFRFDPEAPKRYAEALLEALSGTPAGTRGRTRFGPASG